jgi:hypothetical protein
LTKRKNVAIHPTDFEPPEIFSDIAAGENCEEALSKYRRDTAISRHSPHSGVDVPKLSGNPNIRIGQFSSISLHDLRTQLTH